MLTELSRHEKGAGIKPDPEIDAFMKATALAGQETSLVTDYILKILGLDICAVIMVTYDMRRGISGGQKNVLQLKVKLSYQGPHENVLEFFEIMGFKCPNRKGVANFLQEVTSRKDQSQYWYNKNQPYTYVFIAEFVQSFKSFRVGQQIFMDLTTPYSR
ncbi:hypothetical protein GIB67_036623 [Kingdonia uniflora]|uniref:Uncharacterized protein n=1 Tax=Kingdonia uniflora TaxID=39325 RepID=A0A7J7M0V1_9MAGN|nr:hypothetical protein GIB67_036623 [Kingdonia uniflora]